MLTNIDIDTVVADLKKLHADLTEEQKAAQVQARPLSHINQIVGCLTTVLNCLPLHHAANPEPVPAKATPAAPAQS